MTDADNIDDLVLLANTQIPVESLLHSLQQAAGGIRFYAIIMMMMRYMYRCFYNIHTVNCLILRMVLRAQSLIRVAY